MQSRAEGTSFWLNRLFGLGSENRFSSLTKIFFGKTVNSRVFAIALPCGLHFARSSLGDGAVSPLFRSGVETLKKTTLRKPVLVSSRPETEAIFMAMSADP